ncbi:MAG: septum formation initiator family protein [Gammaproteobacteria bacterium]|nr:septum formation initiator family protein [Gammaproteobacteria bacterium]
MKISDLLAEFTPKRLVPTLMRLTDVRYWRGLSHFDMFIWFLGSIIFLLQVSLWIGPSSVASLLILDYKIYKIEQVNTKANLHNMQLYQRIQGLKQGNDEIEARARVELGMIKQGETFYQLVNQSILKADGAS